MVSMLTSIQSRVSAASLQPAVSSNRKTTRASTSRVFADEVDQAVVAAPKAVRAAPVSARNLSRPILVAGKNLAASNKVAPLLTSSAAPPVVVPASVKSAAETGGAPVAKPSNPVEVISAALTELGYDPSKFKIEPREEFVEYPGGGYWHRYTHVDMPNGAQENYSTDLMLRYPTVTANEIKRLMTA
jgi:hypothetical protein